MARLDKAAEAVYQKEYHVKWYAANKTERRAQILERKKELTKWYNDYKRTLSCIRCGYNEHPAALDFHHRDPTQKDDLLPNLLRNGCSIERLKREMAKCDVLCSNCHRVLHATMRLEVQKSP